MTAVYPGQIRPFSTKVNFIMDIDASHINDLQDEVDAIETTLGRDPQNDGALFGGSALVNPNVSTRVSNAESGANHPFVSLAYSGATNGWFPGSPSVIPWTAKVGTDTNGAWSSGANLTVPRTGYYSITSYASMATATSAPVSSHAYIFRLWAGAALLTGATSAQPGGANYTVELNLAWQGFLNKGDTYHAEFTNASGVNRTLNAAIQSTFLRG